MTATRRADAVVLAALGLIAGFLLWRLDQPLGSRPDSWSEAETIVAAWGYLETGVLAHAGLQQHQVGPPVDPYFLYSNYPPLPSLIYAAMSAVGATMHGLYRLPAIFCSLLGLWLWYRFVGFVLDRATAVAAALLLGSSLGFLAYADHIHQHAYPLAPQMGAMLCFARGVHPEAAGRRAWLLGCAAWVLLAAFLTIELHLWLPTFFVAYTVLFGASISRRQLLMLLLPLALGAGFQGMQGLVGSPLPLDERPSFVDGLVRRSIGLASAPDTPRIENAAGELVVLTWQGYPAFLAERFGRFFGLSWWSVPILALAAFAGPKPARSRALRLLLCLFLAACGWMMIMMQQTAVHVGSMRQLLAFVTLLVAIVVVKAGRTFVGSGAGGWRRWVLPALAAAVLVAHVRSSAESVKVFVGARSSHTLLGVPTWDHVQFEVLGGLPEETLIFTNYSRPPIIRYWSRRPVYWAADEPWWSGRTAFAVMVRYVEMLYQDHHPLQRRWLYLYRVGHPHTEHRVRRLLGEDALLRALTAGGMEELEEADLEAATRAYLGQGPSYCPVVVAGPTFRVFDMAPIRQMLDSVYLQTTPSVKIKDLPAPR